MLFAATKTMIERTDKRLGLKPKRLAADTAYGTGKFLGWLIGAGITPQIPVWDDSVEKVSKMKLWNQSLKQSNPSKWSFKSMLLVRRSP